MKEKVLTAIAAFSFSALQSMDAQSLQTAQWQSYGVCFKAPEGFQVEEDSEEGYTISTADYYISIQLLEGGNIKREELSQELKHIAEDDNLTQQSAVRSFELPQFYGVSITGICETEQCLYSYITTKDGEGGFYVSIIYNQKEDSLPEKILNSFMLEE